MLPEHIRISANPGLELSQFIASKNYSQVVVLTDHNTKAHCYPLIQGELPAHHVFETQAGEEYKNLATCSLIWQYLTDIQADRHALLIVLGGGVLGDMGGFCAATYKRGIDFVLIPTTLLAQADASIGGKLGVDFNHFKNHIGVFQQPVLTLLCSTFLKTLNEAELRSGFAEVIKHALISDQDLWQEISTKTLVQQNWDKLLHHSAEFKYSIIEQDPKEKGIRKILNAGHTIGHAIESYLLADHRKVMHGEAVAAGLVAEAYLAQQRNLLSIDDLEAIRIYISAVYGKLNFSESEIEAIANLTLQDKKNKGNEILCVLLKKIGTAGWDYAISLEEVKRALTFYRAS